MRTEKVSKIELRFEDWKIWITCDSVRYYSVRFGKWYRSFGIRLFGFYLLRSTTVGHKRGYYCSRGHWIEPCLSIFFLISNVLLLSVLICEVSNYLGRPISGNLSIKCHLYALVTLEYLHYYHFKTLWTFFVKLKS